MITQKRIVISATVVVALLVAFYLICRSGQVELIAEANPTKIYELTGSPSLWTEDNAVVGVVPKGEKFSSSWHYISKDTIIYRVKYLNTEGYVMYGDAVPVESLERFRSHRSKLREKFSH